MLPFILAGGAAALGAAGQYFGNKETNRTNQQISQDQMAFQARMSNTSYQRQLADINAAGLNPALIYGGGAGGASTPSGASIAAQNEFGGVADSLMSGVSSAMQGKRLEADLKNLEESNKLMKDQQANTKAATAKTNMDSVLSANLAKKALADTSVSQSTAKNQNAINVGLENQAAFQKTWVGKGLSVFNNIVDSLGGAAGLAKKGGALVDRYKHGVLSR